MQTGFQVSKCLLTCFYKKGGGGNSQCSSNSCEISFEKEELYLHKKWHVGLTELIECTDSSNFLNGLNGCFNMQRGGGVPVSDFFSLSRFWFML